MLHPRHAGDANNSLLIIILEQEGVSINWRSDNAIASMKSPCWKQQPPSPRHNITHKARQEPCNVQISPWGHFPPTGFPRVSIRCICVEIYESCESQIKQTLSQAKDSMRPNFLQRAYTGTKLGSLKLELPAAPVRRAAALWLACMTCSTKFLSFILVFQSGPDWSCQILSII